MRGTASSMRPANGHVFVSDDDRDEVFEVSPGDDGVFGTPDDRPSGLLSRIQNFPSHQIRSIHSRLRERQSSPKIRMCSFPKTAPNRPYPYPHGPTALFLHRMVKDSPMYAFLGLSRVATRRLPHGVEFLGHPTEKSSLVSQILRQEEVQALRFRMLRRHTCQ